jgi:aminoglycoside N3'-acetyltransferase
MDNDISQVGALSEYIRKDRKIIRSAVPFFSILSTKEFIKREEKVYPFGPKSIFDILYKKKGTIIHYGCNFKDGLTFIHYIEQMNKAPVYRYEKVFNGEIKSQQKYYKCKIEMHVRPMNLYIDYDWEKIISELSAQNLIITSKKNSNIRALKSEKIANYISEKMLDDDLYLLKDSCKINIQKELDRLGRPFNILDFENEEA